ncbi:hypothetical protein B0T22DRAFT_179298 [Podospora appendiculata]|uniref:Uncharacterized protein n=1 Tax=Podospora appendiculata TaxID=314037 RepID=A0AAE1CDV2_9PEZI|nr:hypothetical protein B0T22DRAFT_179298 [Podospora appendiculata]
MACEYRSRSDFNRLLFKAHISKALLQPHLPTGHNELHTALATLEHLRASPGQLESAYESVIRDLRGKTISPGLIDRTNKDRLLGHQNYETAYMTYYMMQANLLPVAWKDRAVILLLEGPKPLIYGLFGGHGRPLIYLSDAIELANPIMLSQSLTLASLNYSAEIHEILTNPVLEEQHNDPQDPGFIIDRVSFDGRFSGVMRSGPGFHDVDNIFALRLAKDAIIDYVHQLDVRDPNRLVRQLSELSSTMLSATHKPNQPAFDYHLGRLPTLINSVRVLLPGLEDPAHKTILLRGFWLVMLLTYITQLRPVIDPALSHRMLTVDEMETTLATVRQALAGARERWADMDFLRALRSLWELSEAERGRLGTSNEMELYLQTSSELYLRAALKLIDHWEKWTGRGEQGEETLNIRI